MLCWLRGGDPAESPAHGGSTPPYPPGPPVAVCVEVRNTGSRPGREVVQVYASRPDSAVERPARWLAGFAAVDADPGETVNVGILLPERSFQHWADGGWTLEAGTFGLGGLLVRVAAAHRQRHAQVGALQRRWPDAWSMGCRRYDDLRARAALAGCRAVTPARSGS